MSKTDEGLIFERYLSKPLIKENTNSYIQITAADHGKTSSKAIDTVEAQQILSSGTYDNIVAGRVWFDTDSGDSFIVSTDIVSDKRITHAVYKWLVKRKYIDQNDAIAQNISSIEELIKELY